MYRYLLTAAVLLFLVSCDDDPVSHNDEDHVEAVGFKLLEEDQTVIDHPDNSLTVTGSISVAEGGEVELELFFYNEDGELFNPLEEEHGDHDDHGHDDDHEDEEISIGFSFIEGGVTKSTSSFVLVEVEDEHHDEHGDDEAARIQGIKAEPVDEDHGIHIALEGISAGSTKLVIQILHGDHADFESSPITINVTTPIIIAI